MILPLLDIGSKLIDKFFPNPKDAAIQKAKPFAMQQNGELVELAESVKVITAETNSEHFLVSAWRPITMLTFVFIVANNYILYPYLSLFWVDAPDLVLPPQMWDLLKIGLGGYVAGRSGEKMIRYWKGNKND